ncbi:SseB family protein [Micromonospora endophytica]|nr:SseB family protein [Micromonospora endophytica]
MTAWEPATEAEAAMRDALRNNDQQLYFRILSRVELLLPISAEAPPGHAPAGWGTWTTGGRTHVLAFTSIEAVRACLGEYAGPSRRIGYAELAANWPNHEWWLAVNPGLPVEGYLPAWYVSQLSRGDVRLPGRPVGTRDRLERVEALNRSRAAGPDRPRDAGTATGAPLGPKPSPLWAPTQRPADAGPGSPPVVPPAFPLPDMPVSTPSTGPYDPRPAGSTAEPADAGRIVPDAARTAPRRPMPLRVEEAGAPLRGRPVAPERPGPPTNGRPADAGADQAGRRSFFEPASGRPASRADRLADRATPPSRLGRGGQPFPRRGPAATPPGQDEPRAFVFTDDDSSTGPARPEPGSEATQPLIAPAGPGSEPTRPLWRNHETGPPASSAGGSDETTQTLPRRPPTEPTEESPSIAEPVSSPPAPRRGFTPIVIEGTIIEARDLTITPAFEDRPPPSTPRPSRPPTDAPFAPSPVGVPEATVPGRTAPDTGGFLAPADQTTRQEQSEPEPGIRTAPTPPVTPEPTVPLQAPPAVSFPAEPTVSFQAEPAVSFPAEPTVSFQAEPTVSFPAEPTVALRMDAGGPVQVEPTTAADEAVTTAFAQTGPKPADPAVAASPAASHETHGGQPVPEAATSGPAAASEPTAASEPAAAEFRPANEVEEELLSAAMAGNTDTFLSTLLLARVLMPVAADSAAGSRPGEPGFVWPTVQLDGQTFVLGYTSPRRFADHTDPAADTIQVRFVQLIRQWPDPSWSFAVNAGTPVGAKLPGEQIVGLANWATELGLGDDPESEPEPSAGAPEPSAGQRKSAPADPARPIVMQKAIASSQLGYYLDRGYDRVSGFVHRATELAHLTTPAQLYRALGLHHAESPFAADADEIYVLRWPAYRPSLYRIPYGGQSEAAMRAMEGWVIERPPFRGNGFAPGESSDVLAEFKVDSVRLPHGAQLLRLGADGTERLVAVLDADTLSWRRVGEQ